MPLDQDARRYADNLFTDRVEDTSRKYQDSVVATTSQLAARGLIASGAYYSELVRLGIESARELANARADTLIAAYERAKLPIDAQAAEEIVREVIECCEAQRGNLTTNVQEKTRLAGIQGIDSALAGNIASEILGIEAQIRRKLSRKRDEAVLDARPVAAQGAQPEELDDLLPVGPKRCFGRNLAELTTTADRSAPLSLLMVDFDNFKSVNDNFGHAAGDEVLIGAATAIKAVCRGKGRCYRWGGDELAVLLPNHSSYEASAVAERLRETVADVKFANYPNKVTLSIGVASYPGTCTSADQLFEAADGAARTAKDSGRDRICVAGAGLEDSPAISVTRLSLAERTKRAEKVRIWVRGLTVRNGTVTCGVVNKSEEEITVDEIRLQSSSYDLTEPVFPPSVDAWKVGRQCTWSIYFNCQPDPAATLIRMNDTKGLFFKAELRIVMIYSALDVSREFSQIIPVQVNVSSNEIISLIW
jgi:diguanylate cyclase (GGDEF)-like protein